MLDRARGRLGACALDRALREPTETSGGSAAGAASYKEWVEAEAAKIGSDKCTMSIDWNVWCCYEHDLACELGKDPRDAFVVSWDLAKPQSRREADKRFWKCNRSSNGLWTKLRADIRYLGVRLGALIP